MAGTSVLLHNARLIDGNGGDPLPGAALLIRDTRLEWVGRTEDLAPGTRRDVTHRVDLAGRTVCPGFIDTHVHFALPGTKGSALDGLREPPTYRTLKVLERLRVTLENGVTTARDLMGLDAGFRQAVAERRVPGPRLLVAVTMLSQHAGHADFTMAGGFDALAAAVMFPGSPTGLVDTVDEMRLRVRELVAAGADCVKLASSGGVSSPHDDPEWLGLRPEMIRAAIEEAAAHGGRRVAVHAIGRPGIAAAVRAGVHSVEHGYALDDELRAEMADRGQFLVPTLTETMTDLDPARTSPAIHAKGVRWHRVAQESVARSVEAGVRVAMGTDAGLTPDHGTNLRELELLVRFAGLTPLRAITAGTRDAAELCGLSDTVGTVEAGKLADLVITGADPLSDIAALADPRQVLVVVKDGRVAIDRGAVLGDTLPPLCP
ncbi:metal-dependent hydrolase family protein [Streptomyces otsuchiensis]|uniref:metal-dependent hydrolase family protein n=1 Tax=Streptomyces otsuchiensis TaxID=2681388 RepID=UPI001582D4BC|nr:amidohydrolase family protein [Streptomyces otsuchiensis]